ncbi:hypothetical protein [Mesorhizobium sp. L-8-3]|uniref:hypothetical protein n=1 Tax=Mesorhizobium sp. L-8-3 TaxID=2744522 RepID=UPI001929342F|nr:hypothetical protein [Mesorhizobium sp. L-8-3]BCH21870.1 hypothetical protein MesoLjLb_16550 [Mesorhizobium sp. L-8-3]
MTRAPLIFMTAAAVLSSGAAFAQAPTCGPRDALARSLAEQYREKPQAIGVVDAKTVVEVFVSEAGTWTIIASDTDGNSCVVSAGEGWDNAAVVARLPDG